jgi:ABC-type transporter Mla subunit MlaD
MSDLTSLNAQVAATLAEMAQAADTIRKQNEQIRADVEALAKAHESDDSAGVADAIAKLRAGTDALHASIPVIEAPKVDAPAPVVAPVEQPVQ